MNIIDTLESLFYITRDISIDSIVSIFKEDTIIIQLNENMLDELGNELNKM